MLDNLAPYDHVADLYDIYVRTNLDIPFFLNEAGKTSGEILDLMAGTGRVSLPLIEAGSRVTCVDQAPQMLEVLREKLAKQRLTADVRVQDVRQLALGKRFDLILLPFHAFAELPSSDDQRQTLHAIYEHLAEGGRFICALHNPPVRLKSVDGLLHLMGKYPSAQGRLLVWILQTQRPESGLVEISEFFEEYDAANRMVARRLLEMQVSFLAKRDFEALAQAAGFRVLSLYGDYAYGAFDETASPFMIWVLGR